MSGKDGCICPVNLGFVWILVDNFAPGAERFTGAPGVVMSVTQRYGEADVTRVELNGFFELIDCSLVTIGHVCLPELEVKRGVGRVELDKFGQHLCRRRVLA